MHRRRWWLYRSLRARYVGCSFCDADDAADLRKGIVHLTHGRKGVGISHAVELADLEEQVRSVVERRVFTAR